MDKSSFFGSGISVVDNLVAVGTPDLKSNGSLSVYRIYNHDYVEISSPIQPTRGHPADGFGVSCKLIQIQPHHFQIIIGSHYFTQNGLTSGAAYIYSSHDHGKHWTFDALLQAPMCKHKSFFGCSVDLNSSGLAIVGAHADISNAVYAFQNIDDEWKCIRTITPDLFIENPDTCAHFGFSVALHDSILAIGAPNASSGLVFVLDSSQLENNLPQHALLVQSNYFGFSLSFSNDMLFIGAPGKDTHHGCTYVYPISTFFDTELGFNPIDNVDSLMSKIQTQSKSSQLLFGRSVSALPSEYFLVSGYGELPESNVCIGSAFLYHVSDLQEPIACLRDTAASEWFGHSLSISSDFIIISDPYEKNVHVVPMKRIIETHNVRNWIQSSYKISPNPSLQIKLLP